jgi:hypothetical protein
MGNCEHTQADDNTGSLTVLMDQQFLVCISVNPTVTGMFLLPVLLWASLLKRFMDVAFESLC